MDNLTELLSTSEGLSLSFGFLLYTLFTTWRKLSARWVNWFPLAAKLTRFSLYICAIALAVMGLNVLSVVGEGNNFLLVIGGVCAAPLINELARKMRPKEKVRRGARVADVATVNKQTNKLPAADFKNSFSIGGVKIPRSAEPYHFFVVGSTGSGKSVAITNVLDHIRDRGDIAIVVDSGGEYAARYYEGGNDYIINPFDDRCAPWSPTAELAGPWDAEALAKSMVPDGVGDSKEWNNYAQTLVASVLRKLVELKRLSIKDLLYYVQAAPVEELEPLLAGTPAAAQLVSDKTFGSIRTIAANYLSTYAYLSDEKDPFSVNKFILEGRSGFMFLTYREDQLDSLRNMISCVLDVAARTILALPADRDRRIWLIIDEFASIGKVQSIEAIATKARKVGGCLLIGLQSVSQLKDRYGEHSAQTILSCLSSWLVLRCSDTDTAEYISKYIGDTEVSRMTRGESSSDTGGSDSLSEQIQTQRAVMPIEVQRLANLQGLFKLAGDYPISKVKLSFPAKKKNADFEYVPRDFYAKPMLNLIAETDATIPVQPEPPAAPPVSVKKEDDTPNREKALNWADIGLAKEPQDNIQEEEGEGKVKVISKSPRKSTATMLEKGPQRLEEVLNSLAAGYEDSF